MKVIINGVDTGPAEYPRLAYFTQHTPPGFEAFDIGDLLDRVSWILD